MTKKILITRRFPENGAQLLREAGFEVTQWKQDRPMTQAELIEQTKSHNAILCTLTEKINDYFINECKHLDIISQFGVGYDNIDIEEATKFNITIGNTPGALTDATADIAFGLMLATSRKMFYLHKAIINGEWGYFKPNTNLGIELKNKTLGIFGLGRIGYEMAKRCKGAYNMDIIYHNRTPNQQAENKLNAKLVSFETLLSNSDVISAHCALTSDTKDIFNKEAFNKMKSNAIFINTARGAVHNEIDLTEALKNKTIWGAGLDVTDPEPMNKNNELLNMPNVTVLPHVGSGTTEARTEMARLAAENIIEFYKSGKVINQVKT